jgi:GT2 family glycosyltransferase
MVRTILTSTLSASLSVSEPQPTQAAVDLTAVPRQQPAAEPQLSVVIPTYRRFDLLEGCLASVRRALASLETPEVIVVVDGCADEAANRVRDLDPEADVVPLPERVGFTQAVSNGLSRCSGDWIALLNDDVVVEPDSLRVLLETGLSAPDIGSVAPQVRFFDRPAIINSAGLEIDRLGVAFDRLAGSDLSESGEEPVEVFGVSAGAALYRRLMLEELGGFDETFVAYMEDADLSWRARMHGWRAMYEPRAVVFHHHSATVGHGSHEKYFLVGRNRVRLLAKNATTRHVRRYGVGMVAYDLAYVVFVGLRDRTLAPARGRIAGLREWRRYRSEAQSQRSPVSLVPVKGISAALGRSRTWVTSHGDGRAQ